MYLKSMPSKKRILFISSTTNVPRTKRMAQALNNNNFDVHIIEWDRFGWMKKNEIIDGLFYHRFSFKSNLGITSLLVIPFWMVYILIHLAGNRYDVIQPQNLDNLLPVTLFSKFKKFKIVYDLADCFADGYFPFKNDFLKGIVRNIERKLARDLDCVIFVNPMQIFQLNLIPQRHIIIYNAPYDSFLKYNKKEKNVGQFIVFYGGVFSEDRGLHIIISAVSALNVKLILAGYGPYDSYLRKLALNNGNIIFLGPTKHETILDYTYHSNCTFALYDPNIINNQYASPNKLFEAMVMKTCIIVSAGSYMSEVVRKNKCGLIVNYGDINELRNAIKLLKNNPKLREKLGRNGRRAYERKYGWSICQYRYLKTFGEVLE